MYETIIVQLENIKLNYGYQSTTDLGRGGNV